MNLIKMTDYVLEQNKVLETYINHDKGALFKRCLNYAEFLKQPLKLEIFVPCDEDGDPLEIPTDEEIEKFKGLAFGNFDMDYTRLFNYFEAKEKVLFEGLYWEGDYVIGNMAEEMIYIDEEFCQNMTIEDFLNTIISEIKLTQSAINQINK